MPTESIVINIDDPPMLIKGRVNPFVGRSPTVTPKLIKA
jgi:hypothetical protein